MAEPKTDVLVKSLETLAAQKEEVTGKEKKLIELLNVALSKMGYHIVATGALPKRRGRPPGSKARRPGRPKGSGKTQRRGPGRPPKAKSAPKRRGRPPKAKTD